MVDINYLEEERKKLWESILKLEEQLKNNYKELEKQINNRSSDYEKEAKQHSKKASEYRNKCESSLEISSTYLSQIKEILDNLHKESQVIQKLNDEIKSSHTEVTNTHNQIKEYSNTIADQKEILTKNIEILNTFFEEREEYKEQIETLQRYFNEGEDFALKQKAIYNESTSRKKEIEQLYNEIYGITTEEENGNELHIKGLKDKLEKSYDSITENLNKFEFEIKDKTNTTQKQIDSFLLNKEEIFSELEKDWNLKYQILIEKIENLLPKALTTGLSYAYTQKKDDEIIELRKSQSQFQMATLGLVGVSIIPFILSIIFLYQGIGLEEVIMRVPRLVLAILPLYVPVLWLAYSANKNMRLSKRLIEEYTHKEVLSKTFEGLSTQTENIKEQSVSSELKIKLLYNLISVSSENPGKLISDYDKTDHPLNDALDKSLKLANAVDKLTEIPGMKQIANILNKQSDKIIRETSEKISEGLELIQTSSPEEEENN